MTSIVPFLPSFFSRLFFLVSFFLVSSSNKNTTAANLTIYRSPPPHHPLLPPFPQNNNIPTVEDRNIYLTPQPPAYDQQVKAAEDILSLTRILKEAWLFGKLQTIGVASDEEARVEIARGRVARDLRALGEGQGDGAAGREERVTEGGMWR